MAVVARPLDRQVDTQHEALIARTRRRRQVEGILIDKVLAYGFLIVMCIFALFPFAWMFSTSIKTPQEAFVIPPRWIPNHISFSAYRVLWDAKAANNNNFPRYFLNSAIVSLGTMILSVMIAVPAAYAFARFVFPGKNWFFYAILGRNMFPLVVFLVPLFQLMATLKLQNNYFGLILAYLTFSLPLAIWLLKGFFDNIPVELEKAARIDGCTRFGAFFRVILPLTIPGIVATAIYSFIGAWNEYIFATTLTSDPKLRTLPVGQGFFLTENSSNWAGLMAVSLVISIPVVAFFLLLQRYFIRALTEGAVKG
ncbi:MAG: carbohydrate ABC transporter permease [Chloroflexota bacterium]|nr:carbohydrate ABC transporter permease [Chloroflexota bacterium]MDQ6905250.1 carbohydrate ABC transporter permease [Chloroflexota bacterium]